MLEHFFSLARRRAVPFPAALASLVVDRLFDAAVVFMLMFLAMLDPAFPTGARIFGRSISSVASGGLAVVGIAIVGMYLVVLFPARVMSLFELIVRKVAPALENAGRSALVSLTSGLSVLRTPGRFAAVFGWTLVHWLANGLAFWVAFKAVHIDVPLSAGLFLQGAIAMAVAAPQAPGFWGLFEYAGKEGLGLYGVSPDVAATWAISFHFLSFVPITVIGAWFFLRAGLSLNELDTAERSAETRAEV